MKLSASKMVTDRQKICADLEATIYSNRDKIAQAAAEAMSVYLAEEEQMPDLEHLQQLAGRMLASCRQRLIDADKAHIDDNSDNLEPRLRRDMAADRLRRKMSELRDMARGLFGAELSARLVAIEGSLAFDPVVLWRQSEHTLERLKNAEHELPEHSLSGISIDTPQLTADLEPLVIELGAAIEEVAKERKAALESQLAKQLAMDELDKRVRASVRFLEGLCLLAELPELADRVRPTRRRRRVLEGESEELPEAVTEREQSPGEDDPTAVQTA